MSKEKITSAIPFAAFRRLFKKDTGNFFCLNGNEGIGSMRKLRVDEGVTACIWNFSLAKDLKIETDNPISDKDYCIAFFADRSPLKLCKGERGSNRDLSWDIIFNRSSEFCIGLERDVRYCCLTIHFSGNWLNENIGCLHQLADKLNVSENGFVQISGVDLMTSIEKNLVSQLIDKSTASIHNTLSAKAAVLKMIGDFIERIENMRTTPVFGDKNLLHEIEEILSRNIALNDLNVKQLAKQFSVSQSTLNRRFRSCYGKTIAAHYFSKRMEFVRLLIEDRGLSGPEAAFILGYKNCSNLLKVYRKHFLEKESHS